MDEMLESVEEARGALPLLAFAVSRLWEKRDRERKLLTRKAYEEIGGVAGALAQHAEQTLERIGLEREPIVRELFRNLVTAQWTRAVADREELLSVLPDRETGGQVLDQLIDARLLTSYEVREAEALAGHPERDGDRAAREGSRRRSTGDRRPGRHRIEIVHESLLRAWPRLVRWQAQDEEGAVLRDQLKQAARLWEEKGRPDDLLWTGTSEREFELWRDRYPGKLTALEDDFADAMVAQGRAGAAPPSGGSCRCRGRGARGGGGHERSLEACTRGGAARRGGQAARARRATARDGSDRGPRLRDGEPRAGRHPRGPALRHEGPLERRHPAFELNPGQAMLNGLNFSPDGKWVALSGFGMEVEVWGEDGRGPVVLRGYEPERRKGSKTSWTSSGLLVTGVLDGYFSPGVDVWSLPEGQRVRTIEFEHPGWWQLCGDDLLVEEAHQGLPRDGSRGLGTSSCAPGGSRTGSQRPWARCSSPRGGQRACSLPTGLRGSTAEGQEFFLQPLPINGRSRRLLDRHDTNIRMLGPFGNQFHLQDDSGEVLVWTFPPEGEPFKRVIPKPEGVTGKPKLLDPDGRWLAMDPGDDPQVRLWDLSALPGARPLTLRRNASWKGARLGFVPAGDWLAATTHSGDRLTFWPLPRARPIVVDGYSLFRRALAFSPDGCWLATSWPGRTIRLWPLPGCSGREVRALDLPRSWSALVRASSRKDATSSLPDNDTYLVPLDGAPAATAHWRRLEDWGCQGRSGLAQRTANRLGLGLQPGREEAACLGRGDRRVAALRPSRDARLRPASWAPSRRRSGACRS